MSNSPNDSEQFKKHQQELKEVREQILALDAMEENIDDVSHQDYLEALATIQRRLLRLWQETHDDEYTTAVLYHLNNYTRYILNG